MPKNDTYLKYYTEIYNEWKEKLKVQTGLDDLTLDDIETIYLIPHIISSNDDGKHIDCTISVVCTKAYTAKFNVLYPDSSDYV